MEPSIEGLEFYIDAFRELSTTRSVGFSLGAIPFTAIAEYFTIYDIDGDFDEFASIIRRMDNVYLELNANDLKSPPKKEGEDKSGGNSNTKNPNQG